MRKYSVHKIFGPTIQGEGGMTGTVCHFIRFSGCNMWDGRPETREDSGCPFCDTDFFSHTMMTADQIKAELPNTESVEWVTITGGEPLLQVDQPLIDTLQTRYRVAVETNGTKPLLACVNHLTLSPKLPNSQTVIRECDSLKLLYPHPNPLIRPEHFEDICAKDKYLQPIDTGDTQQTQNNIERTIQKVYELRGWKISLQTHKLLGVE